MTMYQTPRLRRLRNDLAALERLRSESSVFRFTAQGNPPQQYHILFQGKGLWRDHGKVKVHETHRVEIKLGASYPRTMPEIRWMTPVYHPNISEIGMVCLGGYGTHWVPSVQLDELCTMLWDMLRYHNYDIRSPYNRDAALWVASQTMFLFPTDSRPLRDLRAALGRVAPANASVSEGSESISPTGATASAGHGSTPSAGAESKTPIGRVRQLVGRYGRVLRNGREPESPGNGRRPESQRRREEVGEILSHFARYAQPSSESQEPDHGENAERMASNPELLANGLKERIDRLNQYKEEALANQNYERAAALRDLADKLMKRESSTLASAEVNSTPAGRDDEPDDEVTILETSTEAQHEAPRPNTDEIIFIE
jgi:ubiquitin-protein ligase